MKIKVFIFILCASIFGFCFAMEKPEPLPIKQPLAGAFERRLEQESKKPKTQKEIQALTKKAQKGDLEAQVNLAWALYYPNPEQALVWLKKANAQGYEDPSFSAELYFSTDDMKNAEKFAEQAVLQNDFVRYALLGAIKIAEGDPKAALELYDRSIQAGNINAYYARFCERNLKNA